MRLNESHYHTFQILGQIEKIYSIVVYQLDFS